MARVTNAQLLTEIEGVNKRLDDLSGTVRRHDTEITALRVYLERGEQLSSVHETQRQKDFQTLRNSGDKRSVQIDVLQNREREAAIDRAKHTALSALIGAGIATIPQIIAALR